MLLKCKVLDDVPTRFLPSAEMAVVAQVEKAKPAQVKNQKTPKFRVRQVLASPFETTWPEFSEEQLKQISEEIARCTLSMLKPLPIQPKWKDLQKVDKDKRKDAIAMFRQTFLESLPAGQKEKLLEEEIARDEKWSHVFLGYNKIMRELEKGTVAALLVNKNVQPEFLPMTFLPICKVKKIPLVPVDNLDNFYKNTIAIGFKLSVMAASCPFYSLYSKMTAMTESSYQDTLGSSVTDASSDKTLVNKSRLRKQPAPRIQVGKFHLQRTRDDQCSFVPGVGMNPKANMDETEYIMIGKDDPLLDCPVELLTNIGCRAATQKSHSKSKKTGKASSEAENVTKQSSNSLFLFDLGGDEAEPKKKTPKRSRSEATNTTGGYLPANVLRLVGNSNKKNKKDT